MQKGQHEQAYCSTLAFTYHNDKRMVQLQKKMNIQFSKFDKYKIYIL